MNIFIVHNDPKIAAQMLCDNHVTKMILESAQMLRMAFPRDFDTPDTKGWSHVNHPCSIWTRETEGNYEWHLTHALELCREYTFRYGKTHAWEWIVNWFADSYGWLSLPSGRTPFHVAMPDCFKEKDAVTSYRNYYVGDKIDFARWRKHRRHPRWWERRLVELFGKEDQ